MQNEKVHLWALGILGYNRKIEYISGMQNTCADVLSRSPSLLSFPDCNCFKINCILESFCCSTDITNSPIFLIGVVAFFHSGIHNWQNVLG
jgi:hypothetical protein